MPIRKTITVLTSALLLAGTLGTAAAAGLKDKPPNGVKLSGSWRLDPDRSDDPRVVLERAAKEAKDKRDNPDRGIDRTGGPLDRNGCDPMGRDPLCQDRDPMGRSTSRGTWGGGDGSRRGDPFPDTGGAYRRDRGGASSTIDPTGGGGSVTWGTGNGAMGINNVWMLQLDPSPDLLTILDYGKRVSVSENKLETECAAGEDGPLADSFGDGKRRCGWSGKAWVIETTRDKRFKRTDRFELAKNGAVLTYTTSASGQNIPSVRIFRTYELIPATTSP
jgi:hypothetical protein